MRISDLTKVNLNYLISFLSFVGFYAGLEVIFFTGLSTMSRFYTIPVRFLVTVAMVYLMAKMKFRHLHKNQIVYLFFFLFWLAYFAAIFRSSLGNTSHFHISPFEFFAYSIIYGFVPFLYFSLRHDETTYLNFKNALVFSGLVFAVLSTLIYGKFLVSGVGRLSRAQYTEGGDFSAISPLILSYMSTLIISVCAYDLLFRKVSARIRQYYLATIFISLVPFFLGASRGSIVAIGLTFLIIIFYRGSLKTKIRSLIGLSVFGVIVFFFAGYFGSALFDRFLSMSADLEAGDKSMARLVMWRGAWLQFMDSPVWGDSVQSNIQPHPHNIFLEVLMAVGWIGFLPFIMLLIFSVRRSIKIIKERPELVWIFILYLQGLIKNSFSGTVYSAVFFWAGLGLVFSVPPLLKEEPKT